MAHEFAPDVVAAVLRHMNTDHTADNPLIVRAFAGIDAVSAEMTGFDGDGGEWTAQLPDGAEDAVRISWPGGSIADRAAVRREIVALYDTACERLGVTPRPH
ncbi:DUF2470 domain-containing protein [Microbacterium marinilacus]|uniref:DUF2470 domain-containing protein n=1 Tax=Microbacterium marinilacus TaxID=415209 RepID=A0ABP7BW37_9MICO|nr:DUF2470 domain-containing protein [Microbacterium marinilacus]MBY0688293.1 DUF2470 domain-containing protein [Microbacterium marinilacus]